MMTVTHVMFLFFIKFNFLSVFFGRLSVPLKNSFLAVSWGTRPKIRARLRENFRETSRTADCAYVFFCAVRRDRCLAIEHAIRRAGIRGLAIDVVRAVRGWIIAGRGRPRFLRSVNE